MIGVSNVGTAVLTGLLGRYLSWYISLYLYIDLLLQERKIVMKKHLSR